MQALWGHKGGDVAGEGAENDAHPAGELRDFDQVWAIPRREFRLQGRAGDEERGREPGSPQPRLLGHPSVP